MIRRNVPRRAVLGIDAAWTEGGPSGVALAVETGAGWRLAAVEASYEDFLARAEGGELVAALHSSPRDGRPFGRPLERGRRGQRPRLQKPRGSKPDAAALLGAAQRLCGRRIDLVAVDMPLS
ncbi:MAG: hypothetical protein JO288_19175, partial [Hyphomicrobiales bacterium]|nr:hypothetical protein [Hyphomicrobiales bacterium]